jgi:hypothetical protein
MDWTGNTNSVFKNLGASNHCEETRQIEDYYATDPIAIKLLLKETFFSDEIWEPACGQGHLSEALKKYGYQVYSTDLINRGYGDGEKDFLACSEKWEGDIITNPPYKFAQEFVEKSLGLISSGHKVAMFLKLTFLEGKARREMFKKYPPKTIYVFSGRITCAKNGDFASTNGSAVCYAWFIWEKGFCGDPAIKWIN